MVLPARPSQQVVAVIEALLRSCYVLGMNVQSHIADLFRELEDLLKQPDAAASLAELGVNTSIALVAAEGLHSYLKGDKEAAAEDLSTAAEEVRSRLAASKRFGDESN